MIQAAPLHPLAANWQDVVTCVTHICQFKGVALLTAAAAFPCSKLTLSSLPGSLGHCLGSSCCCTTPAAAPAPRGTTQVVTGCRGASGGEDRK